MRVVLWKIRIVPLSLPDAVWGSIATRRHFNPSSQSMLYFFSSGGDRTETCDVTSMVVPTSDSSTVYAYPLVTDDDTQILHVLIRASTGSSP